MGIQAIVPTRSGRYYSARCSVMWRDFRNEKIVSMAEAYDMAAAPHAPYGPIALAATLQVDVCSPNVFIQEQSLGIHYNKGFDLLDFIKNKEVFQYKDGYVDIPKNQDWD